MINVKQFAKFVVDLADTVAPTDIEEGMRVGVDRNKYQVIKLNIVTKCSILNIVISVDSSSFACQN
jgi:ATP-dependent 26S proteasome regulatory subunit